jgi:hypothetical protein
VRFTTTWNGGTSHECFFPCDVNATLRPSSRGRVVVADEPHQHDMAQRRHVGEDGSAVICTCEHLDRSAWAPVFLVWQACRPWVPRPRQHWELSRLSFL